MKENNFYIVKWFQFTDTDNNSKAPVNEYSTKDLKDAEEFAQGCYDNPYRAVHMDSLNFVKNK